LSQKVCLVLAARLSALRMALGSSLNLSFSHGLQLLEPLGGRLLRLVLSFCARTNRLNLSIHQDLTFSVFLSISLCLHRSVSVDNALVLVTFIATHHAGEDGAEA